MNGLSLLKILEAFNAPINEEQAWAICYQCCKHLIAKRNNVTDGNLINLEGINSDKSNGKCTVSFESSDFCLSIDGTVEYISICSASSKSQESQQKLLCSIPEIQLVRALGVMMFQALDYGLSETEEQKISSALEQLIERMTDSVGGTDEGQNTGRDSDEGIEEDDENQSSGMTLELVARECIDRAKDTGDAAGHYRAVCRALITEAFELMTFLEKIYTERERLKSVGDSLSCSADSDDVCHLESLQRTDWARLWIQLMRELRQGVKLKKVQATITHPVEYELTPYEILMDDLRYKRYTLNKIPHEEDRTPLKVKKDVHAIILDFIRSRPPLHPAGDRKLMSPPVDAPDVREQMLRAIRSDRPQLKTATCKTVETSRTRLDCTDGISAPTKKIIKPDLSLLISNSFDDELNDDDSDDDDKEMNKVSVEPLTPFTPLSPNAIPKHLPWQQTDVSTSSGSSSCSSLSNRHSIAVCESPQQQKSTAAAAGSRKVCSTNGHQSDQLAQYKRIISADPRGGKSSLECLSLTVEEVMHIRNVLTKAELECLVSDTELYKLLETGKICFTCKKTKFSLFGTWATTCKFCFRNVCSNCISKMRIPTEHFEHVPVYTLSPSPDVSSYESDLQIFNGSGSVPASPDCLRAMPLPADSQTTTTSEGMSSFVSRMVEQVSGKVSGGGSKRAPLSRAQTTVVDDKPSRPVAPISGGPLMNVCKDCRSMIVSIIRASRRSLAQLSPRKGGVNKVFSDSPHVMSGRDFHLDLKPLYREH